MATEARDGLAFGLGRSRRSVFGGLAASVLNLFLWGREGGPWSEATEARDGLAFGLGRSRG